MNTLKSQSGVGLVEVLVALVLLAIGVLGYVAVQLRAVDASGEALTKSQAVLVMRGLAENIRSNPQAMSSYPAQVQNYSSYSEETSAPTTCYNSPCTPTQMATYDAYNSAKNAHQYGMKLTMDNCPGVTTSMSMQRKCLYAFWGKTTPSVSNCMTSEGTYVNGATCLMMEVY